MYDTSFFLLNFETFNIVYRRMFSWKIETYANIKVCNFKAFVYALNNYNYQPS